MIAFRICQRCGGDVAQDTYDKDRVWFCIQCGWRAEVPLRQRIPKRTKAGAA